jgi:hypothetical protein
MIRSGCTTRQVIERFGGASRARTDDLIVANDALSQLSYSPVSKYFSGMRNFSSALRSRPASGWFCFRVEVENPLKATKCWFTNGVFSRLIILGLPLGWLYVFSSQ